MLIVAGEISSSQPLVTALIKGNLSLNTKLKHEYTEENSEHNIQDSYITLQLLPSCFH